MGYMIEVEGLKKYYKIAKRDKGLMQTMRGLFKRKYEIRKAVDDISFQIKKGEIVGKIPEDKIIFFLLFPASTK